MHTHDMGIPLETALSLPDGKIHQTYLDIMLEEDLPVLYINRSKHIHKLTPIKPLYDHDPFFWRESSAGSYFLTGYGLARLKELAIAREGLWNVSTAEEDIEDDIDDELAGFGSEYEAVAQMSAGQMAEKLSRDKIQLNELLIKKSKDQIAIAETLASTAKDAAMINHTILEKIIDFADEQAKAYSREVVDYTNEIVKSSAQLISKNIVSDELLKTITEKSRGIVFQHITRVYLNGVAFLAYFNNKMSSSSAVIKIRSSFNFKYRKFYQALLPHIGSHHLTLDRVFMEGLRIVPSDMFLKWSAGFLIHDLGKASDIEYHEGEAAYDRDKVVDHVKVGYRSILSKTNYPRETALIAGYHHEYYGDPDGYGPYREDLQQFKSNITNRKQEYCITCDFETILAFRALAYFPAKILEIIDVYDSLTDQRRVYRASMSSQEALDTMYREFIIKRRKIDPILFDIFTSFIREKESSSANEK